MKIQHSDVGDPAEPLGWLVYRAEGRNEKLLGIVIAPTPKTALAAAFKEFHVTPTGRKRITVRRATSA
jgi:hypothetical protein